MNIKRNINIIVIYILIITVVCGCNKTDDIIENKIINSIEKNVDEVLSVNSYIKNDKTEQTEKNIPEELWDVDENTIIWAFFDDLGQEQTEKLVNNKLQEDGYPFRLKCVSLGMVGYTERVKDCKADIIFDGVGFEDSVIKWTPAYDAIEEGKLLKIDEYLKDSALYDFFPEMMWDSIRVNGSIYSVPNTNFGDSSLFVVFKRSAYTEEELLAYDNTLESILSMVSENKKLFYGSGKGWTAYLDMYGISNYDNYGIYFENEQLKNVMELDINIRWITEMHKLATQGKLINGSEVSYKKCIDDWTVAILDGEKSLDLNEDDYYIVRYMGDMYPKFGGAIAIRENSHNPEYAFKMIELFITNSDYGNLIIYGSDLSLIDIGDGYAIDSKTGQQPYTWSKRIRWAINDGVIKGEGDYKLTFDTPEERKEYYKEYVRPANLSIFENYELMHELESLVEKYGNIIFTSGNFEKELNEWIDASKEAFEKYG